MLSATEFVDQRRPAGGRRSGKRDFIVSVFLRQEGHIAADDFVDLIRGEDSRLSRATIYRTLQWMVDAGIARLSRESSPRIRSTKSSAAMCPS